MSASKESRKSSSRAGSRAATDAPVKIEINEIDWDMRTEDSEGKEAKEVNEVNEAKSLPEERGKETRSVRPGGAATNKATSVDSGSLTDCLWWWCVCMAITERYYRETRSSHKLGMAQISDMYARRERMVLVVVGSSSHGVEGVIV